MRFTQLEKGREGSWSSQKAHTTVSCGFAHFGKNTRENEAKLLQVYRQFEKTAETMPCMHDALHLASCPSKVRSEGKGEKNATFRCARG